MVSRLRRFAMLLLCAVVLPGALILIVEVALRAGGFGETRAPFRTATIDGERILIQNRAFIQGLVGWQMQPSNWRGSELAIPVEKDDGAARVFVLGGSAARGWPSSHVGFNRMLKVLLKQRYPELGVFIYNLAFEGMNSHVMRRYAEEAAGLSPDLFVVYMGNNEFSGPFGSVNIEGVTQRVPTAATARRLLGLKDLRLLQLAPRVLPDPVSLVQQAGVEPAHGPDVRIDTESAAQVYENFETNLHAIVQAARGAGAQAILSTVAVNEQDWLPNIFEKAPEDWSVSREWLSHFLAGEEQRVLRHAKAALEHYDKALAIGPEHAGLHYRMAETLLEAGEAKQAREHFQRAVDLDTLEWVRADSRINAIIDEVAEAYDERDVYLALVAEHLADVCHNGILNAEVFVDQCHLNYRGQYEAAKALLPQVERVLEERGFIKANTEPLPDLRETIRLLGEPLRDWMHVYEVAAGAEGFRPGQRIQAEVVLQLEGLRRQYSAEAESEDELELREDALRFLAPDGPALIRYFAVLSQSGDVEAIRVALADHGGEHFYSREWLRELCRAHGVVEDWEALESSTAQGLSLYPGDPLLLILRGDAQLNLGEAERAEGFYYRATRVPFAEDAAYQRLANLEEQRGDAAAARAWYVEGFERFPDSGFLINSLFLLDAETLEAEELVEVWEGLREQYPENAFVEANLQSAYEAVGLAAQSASQ